MSLIIPNRISLSFWEVVRLAGRFQDKETYFLFDCYVTLGKYIHLLSAYKILDAFLGFPVPAFLDYKNIFLKKLSLLFVVNF